MTNLSSTPHITRNPEIDWLRGLATLGILAIHTAFWTGEGYVPKIFQSITLFFDMPLMFFVSGMAFAMLPSAWKGITVLARFQWRYMVLVTGLWVFITISHTPLDVSVLKNWLVHNYSDSSPYPIVMGSMWFVLTYVTLYIVSLIVLRIPFKPLPWALLVALLATVYTGFAYAQPLTDNYVLFYGAFFVIGFLYAQNRLKLAGLIALGLAGIGWLTYQNPPVAGLLTMQAYKFPPQPIYFSWSIAIVALVASLVRLAHTKSSFRFTWLTYVGQNAIFFFFAQGVSSSLLGRIMPFYYRADISWWGIYLISLAANIIMCIGIAFIIKRVDVITEKLAGLAIQPIARSSMATTIAQYSATIQRIASSYLTSGKSAAKKCILAASSKAVILKKESTLLLISLIKCVTRALYRATLKLKTNSSQFLLAPLLALVRITVRCSYTVCQKIKVSFIGLFAQPASESRDLSIDALRGIAVLGVLLSHTVFWSGEPYTPKIMQGIVLLLGTPLMFFVAGRSMAMASSQKKSTINLLRLQFHYMVFVTLLWCLINFYDHTLSINTLWHWITHRYTDSSPYPIVMGSMWFMLTYFIISGIALVLLPRLNKAAVFALTAALIALVYTRQIKQMAPQTNYVIFYGALFMIGYHYQKKYIGFRSIAALTAISMAWLATQSLPMGGMNQLQIYKFPADPVFFSWMMVSVSVTLLAVTVPATAAYLINRPLVFMGRNALYFFMAQGVSSSLLLMVINYYYNWEMEWWGIFTFSLTINIILCTVFMYILKAVINVLTTLATAIIRTAKSEYATLSARKEYHGS